MAEGPPPVDQGAALFARGGNAQPTDTAKPAASMQEMMDQLFELIGNWVSKASGVRINSFFNVGMFGGTKLEDGGIKTGNNIMMSSLAQGSQGGVLAGVASIVAGNWDMQGVSAPSIDAASGGDSGGGSDSGGSSSGSSSSGNEFESFASHSGMGEIFIAAGSNRFSYEDFSPAGLGTISPQSIGDASMGRGEGVSV